MELWFKMGVHMVAVPLVLLLVLSGYMPKFARVESSVNSDWEIRRGN